MDAAKSEGFKTVPNANCHSSGATGGAGNYINPNYPNAWPTYPRVCPTCGKCPTCGNGGYYIPQTTWVGGITPIYGAEAK